MPSHNETERAEYTDGLRKLADWLDANPPAPLPYRKGIGTNVGSFEFGRLAKTVPFERQVTDDWNVSLEVDFGLVTYGVGTSRGELGFSAPEPTLPHVPVIRLAPRAGQLAAILTAVGLGAMTVEEGHRQMDMLGYPRMSMDASRKAAA